MNKNLVFIVGVTGAFLFIIPSILGGLWIDGYSFISQYISESFATGIPNATYLRYMYVVSGILLLLFSLTAPSLFPKSKGLRIGFLLFGLLYGLGNVTVALFPCDAGCPTDIGDSSLSQVVHNASAFLTYSLVPLCLIGIGFTARKIIKETSFPDVSIFCGVLALIFVIILFGNPKGSFIGLFQRIIEGSILGWVLLTSVYIRKRQK